MPVNAVWLLKSNQMRGQVVKAAVQSLPSRHVALL